ncbi:MAG: 50S ribosomal protein L25 [Acidobacteriota bacterium]
MSELNIDVELREQPGKGANRRLRAAGKIPAVVYGGDRGPVAIQTERRAFLALLKQAGTDNAVFQLKVPGTKNSRHVMIREMDVNPTTREVRHIDFLRILMTEAVRVSVAVELLGTPEGVKNEGGLLDFNTREILVECLPTDIPQHIELDVSALTIGDTIEAREVELPKGVTLVADDADKVIASVAPPPTEEEEVEEEDEGLIESETAEPEVIGEEKDEDSSDDD